MANRTIMDQTACQEKVKIHMFNSWAQFFASGFGSGMSPLAPGTCGTLMALPIWYFLVAICELTGIFYGVMIAVSFLLGVWVCGRASRELKVHDHGGIVWDEFVGFFITMIAVPMTWGNVILGFVLFRIFDIVKPYPIRQLDAKISGGMGIMIDDVVAGVFALIGIHLVNYLI